MGGQLIDRFQSRKWPSENLKKLAIFGHFWGGFGHFGTKFHAEIAKSLYDWWTSRNTWNQGNLFWKTATQRHKLQSGKLMVCWSVY
jgi:hypothetical protein